MKKQTCHFFVFFFFLLANAFYAFSSEQNLNSGILKNIVFRQHYDLDNICNLEINLSCQDVVFKNYFNPYITVEISCNNKKYLPEVLASDETLTIIENTGLQNRSASTKGNFCTVYVYLPEKFPLENLSARFTSGSIYAESLNSNDSFIVTTESGNINISSSNYIYLQLQTETGKINASEIYAEFFDMTSTKGDAEIQLTKAPLATSSINTDSANVNLIIPRTENFILDISSQGGQFTDNFNRTKLTPKRTGHKANHFSSQIPEAEVPVIKLATKTGDMILSF